MNESENQFSFTRAAPSTGGHAKKQIPISSEPGARRVWPIGSRQSAIGNLKSLWLLALLAWPAALPAQVTNLLVNGDFSQGLAGWTTGTPISSAGYPKFDLWTGDYCVPALGNHIRVGINVPFGTDGYIEQTVTVPAVPVVLSFMSYNTLDPTTLIISIIDGAGAPHVLASYVPPSVDLGGGETCSGAAPVFKSFNLAAFAGQRVTVRLEGTSTNFDLAFANFAEVSIPFGPLVQWRGGIGNWSNTNMWTPFPPSSNAVVLLPAGSTVFVDVPGAQAGGLTLDAGSALNVQAGGTLTTGPVLNSGDLSVQSGGNLAIGSIGAGGNGFTQSGGTVNIDGTVDIAGMGVGSGGNGIAIQDGDFTVGPGGNVAVGGFGEGGNGLTQSGGSVSIYGTVDIAGMSVGSGGSGIAIQDGDFTVGSGGNVAIGGIGAGGNGLTQSGGTVSIDGTVALAAGSGSGGSGIALQNGQFGVGPGGKVAVSGFGSVAPAIAIQNGDFAVASGGDVVVANPMEGGINSIVQSGGGVQIMGTVDWIGGIYTITGGDLGGDGTLDGSVDASGGDVSPGDAPGTLTITSNFTQEAGSTLRIKIAGRLPGQFDQLRVGGAVVLGGQLEVDLLDGFAPDIGEQFPFLVTTNLSGAFSQVSAPAGISITYTNTGVVPVVTGIVPTMILGPALSGANAVLTFGTVTNRSYTVEWSTNLAPANWQVWTNLTGSGMKMSVSVPVSGTARRFFRVSQP